MLYIYVCICYIHIYYLEFLEFLCVFVMNHKVFVRIFLKILLSRFYGRVTEIKSAKICALKV